MDICHPGVGYYCLVLRYLAIHAIESCEEGKITSAVCSGMLGRGIHLPRLERRAMV